VKILVYPHDLAIGGSQLNAIEIAAAVNRLGHPVTIVGRSGALVDRINELGLEFVELPAPTRRPSLRVVRALTSLVRDREIDIIHGYEWPPTLEALWTARTLSQATVTSTVMSMAVAPFIPKTVPLQVGTAEIAAAEREFGRHRVGLLEPPVDLAHNDAVVASAGRDFRRTWGIPDSDILLVAVTRLAHQLKLEGLLSAMRTVGRLRGDLAVRLVVVGDGPARDVVSAAADTVNLEYGAGTVLLTGETSDPRPAYASADVALGMGGSALRAMAFSKPLIVQGEKGFFRLLSPESVDDFLWRGWYGVGTNSQDGSLTLERILRELLVDRARREELGAYGRRLVEDRFSLERAAEAQLDFYHQAMSPTCGRAAEIRHDVAGGWRYVRYYAAKRARRAMGVRQRDDFNVRPVAASPRVATGAATSP
jgi:glycosyltransferase involved in cell wall biosynthesis